MIELLADKPKGLKKKVLFWGLLIQWKQNVLRTQLILMSQDITIPLTTLVFATPTRITGTRKQRGIAASRPYQEMTLPPYMMSYLPQIRQRTEGRTNWAMTL
ncbi:MAG TPA: hypothetical protein DEQ20_00565 [Desulfobulbaceae bacterium]|nr:hypothetical protein [Desulfobulbaceae bacterium]